MKQSKKCKLWVLMIISLLVIVLVWIGIRHHTIVPCTMYEGKYTEEYSEKDKVISAISLSYLVYGCEGCTDLNGTVENILDNKKMGIIIENADIARKDKNDPTTALIDSASFIRQTVGDYRFLMDIKDERSSFYGAAFADDKHQVVWIAYSGSVSFVDALECGLLVVKAGLSGQEKRAFELYENVMETKEMQNGYSLILTGHSLGGALASMVSYMSNAEAITISGADGVALSKIKSIKKDVSKPYHISNYLTSYEGFKISIKDIVQRMMFWGDYDGVSNHVYQSNGKVDNSHCVFGFIQFENDDQTKPFLPKEIIK